MSGDGPESIGAAGRDLAPGAVIAGKYRLVVCIGRGGMGQVWRAQDLVLGSQVALKMIEPELLAVDESRAELVARFLREAQAAAAIRSPHVVQIIEFGAHGQTPYIAMEVLEGETLDALLVRQLVLPYATTASILTHVGRAMARAHELGIVHRDLKPANVFLTRNDDEVIAKVMDFGIAKRTANETDTAGMTRTGRIVGTPAYMSPEQMLGNKHVDGQADMWAMAVIAYECVVGRRPFEGTHGELTIKICAQAPPVPSRAARVPPGFDAWFERATRRDATRRFGGAKEMADALRAVLTQPNLPPPDIAGARARAGKPEDTEEGIVTAGHMTAAAAKSPMKRALVGLGLGVVLGGAVIAALVVRDRGGATPASAPPAATSADPASSASATASSTTTAAATASAAVAAAPSAASAAPDVSPGATAPAPSTTTAPADTQAPRAKPAPAEPRRPPASTPPKARDPRLGF
jgi:serine/threonine-protein kinase